MVHVNGDPGRLPGGPLNILCLAGWWPEGNVISGIFIQEHIRAIAEQHSVVVVFAEVLKGRSLVPKVSIDRTEEFGFPVYRIRVRTLVRRFGVDSFLVRRAYERLIPRLHREKPFSLIHVHVRTPETEHSTGLADKLGLPVVVTEHNSYYHLGIRALPPEKERQERKGIRQWFTHPRIAAVMPVSKDLARVLHEDYGVPQTLMTIVPNVAAAVFKPGIRSTAPPFRVALAAHWRPPKDPDVFIDALRRLPPVILDRLHVDVIGGGPDMERFRGRAMAELPGSDMHFHGQLAKPAIAELFQQAHLFILPTTADNLPCVVIESLSCGTPVLSMAVNGVPELVHDGDGVLVPPSNPVALAEALQAFVEGGHRFDPVVIARDARALYSSGAVAQRIDDVYRSALRSS